LDLCKDFFKEQCDRQAPLVKKKDKGVNYPWLTHEIKKEIIATRRLVSEEGEKDK